MNIKVRGIHDWHYVEPIPKKELRRLYWKEGLSMAKIGERFGIYKGLVYSWLKRFKIPTRKSHDWHYVDVDLTPSPTLAYVLGALLGDGNITPRYEIRLRVIDQLFADSFEKALLKLRFRARHSKTKADPKNRKPNSLFKSSGCSKKFYDWFQKLSLEDMKGFALRNREMTISFVRGFYESEGLSNRAGVVNTNSRLLMVVKECIEKLGFTTYLCGPYETKHKPIYHLYVSRTEGKAFIKLIKPVIKNKVLGEYM